MGAPWKTEQTGPVVRVSEGALKLVMVRSTHFWLILVTPCRSDNALPAS